MKEAEGGAPKENEKPEGKENGSDQPGFTLTQADFDSLNGTLNYLLSRPMSEVEDGVNFLRGLLKRIQGGA